jgi:ArsR family metal-binding transcriptional regulator
MLLRTYTKGIFRPECNPKFESLHCIAHLDHDISEVLPYLNAVLGGFEYLKDPPAVTFKVYGRLITVQPRQIAINALQDEEEADKILEWLKERLMRAGKSEKRSRQAIKELRNPRFWRFSNFCR